MNWVSMRTKLCPKCQQVLKIEGNFTLRKSGTPNSYCKLCQSSFSKEHYNKYRELHNKRRYINQTRYRLETRTFIQELKQGRPCMDCGEVHPYWAMDFDHRDPLNKKFSIGEAPRRASSRDKLLKEIEKCDLVCALCHRYRTYGERRFRV